MRLGLRNGIRKGCWLTNGVLEIEMVKELAAFVVYCCVLLCGRIWKALQRGNGERLIFVISNG